MRAAAFAEWLRAMKAAGIAKSSADCARLLGITPDSASRMKYRGADQRTALACAALLAGLKPYGAEE